MSDWRSGGFVCCTAMLQWLQQRWRAAVQLLTVAQPDQERRSSLRPTTCGRAAARMSARGRWRRVPLLRRWGCLPVAVRWQVIMGFAAALCGRTTARLSKQGEEGRWISGSNK